MEINKTFVFQADSELVNQTYIEQNNYLIEYSEDIENYDIEFCAIYFSSNDLYYPNDFGTFQKEIKIKNKFEWYGNRINRVQKHIFLRDIKKQWYLEGINSKISTPELLLQFLKFETKGYNVITVGSSAGGYAAVLYGQLLSAYKIFSFNGQFELKSLLKKSNELIDPLIFRHQNTKEKVDYYDIIKFIINKDTIFYFNSTKSKWDSEQLKHASSSLANVIKFKTNNHGLPFYRFNLGEVLNLSENELKKLCYRVNSPFGFSVKSIGMIETIYLYLKLAFDYFFKLANRKIHKIKF